MKCHKFSGASPYLLSLPSRWRNSENKDQPWNNIQIRKCLTYFKSQTLFLIVTFWVKSIVVLIQGNGTKSLRGVNPPRAARGRAEQPGLLGSRERLLIPSEKPALPQRPHGPHLHEHGSQRGPPHKTSKPRGKRNQQNDLATTPLFLWLKGHFITHP